MLSLPFCSCRAALHWFAVTLFMANKSDLTIIIQISWVGIGIFFMTVWYRYFEIPRYSIFLKYWLKIANFWYPTSIWHPCWGLPHRKLEWWGHHAMKKFDSKFGRFDISKWQTDGHRTTAKTDETVLWVTSHGKHLTQEKRARWQKLEITSQQRTGLNIDGQ